ncbi:MAG TPA: PDZ domain-containing protein, partial [Luteitalea sp.]|nr:PDZ domain-containing protein [Luteitalea sp.]
MTAPVATPAEPTHDAVTSALLRHRRLLGTLVLLGLMVVGLHLVVSLLRARTQPWLGLQTHRLGASVFARPGPDGAVSVGVIRQGGPAARAGLRPGDRVHTIDGIRADDVRALVGRHDQLLPGERVTYEIERDGHRHTRTLTVAPLLHERRQWVGVTVRVVLVFALFLGIPAVVYKWRPHDPRALLFMLFSNTFGLSMLNFAVPGAGRPPESVIPMPDAYMRVNAMGVLLTYVCALIVSPTLLHFLALFPKPRLAPETLARLLRWTYLIPAAVAWVASPVCVLLLTRHLPRSAGSWATAGIAVVCAMAAWSLWSRRPRTAAPQWMDRPLRPVSVAALLFTAAVLGALAVVQSYSRATAGLLGGLLMVVAVALFSLCIGVGYPVASGIAMWRSWRLSSDDERRQIRWPLLSITWALGIVVLLSIASLILPFTSSAPPAWLYPVFEASTWIAYSVIPLAFAAAVLRYGLM